MSDDYIVGFRLPASGDFGFRLSDSAGLRIPTRGVRRQRKWGAPVRRAPFCLSLILREPEVWSRESGAGYAVSPSLSLTNRATEMFSPIFAIADCIS
jgi:hypothetical protein